MLNKLVILSLLFVCLMFQGCQPNDQASQGSESNQFVPGFILKSYQLGYTYTVFINGEPVTWHYSSSASMVLGFPIKQGTNHVSVEIVILPNYRNGIRSEVQISMETLVRRTNGWADNVDLDKWQPFNEPYAWNFNFEVPQSASDPEIVFDELGNNKERLVQECRNLAVKLVGIIRERDAKKMAQIFRLKNEAAVSANFPGLLIETPASELSLDGITDESELTVKTGKSFILVYSTTDKHLFSIQEGDAARQYLDNFVFAKIGGELEVMVNNGPWLKLNLKALN